MGKDIKICVSYGRTFNIGNYESARIDLSMETEAPEEQSDVEYGRILNKLKDKLLNFWAQETKIDNANIKNMPEKNETKIKIDNEKEIDIDIEKEIDIDIEKEIDILDSLFSTFETEKAYKVTHPLNSDLVFFIPKSCSSLDDTDKVSILPIARTKWLRDKLLDIKEWKESVKK